MTNFICAKKPSKFGIEYSIRRGVKGQVQIGCFCECEFVLRIVFESCKGAVLDVDGDLNFPFNTSTIFTSLPTGLHASILYG